MNVEEYLAKQSKVFWAVIGLLLVTLLGVIDYLTGPALSFVIFYFFPIFLVSWFAGRRAGFLIAVVSTITSAIADTAAPSPKIHPIISYWNVIAELFVFLILAYILSRLKSTLEDQKELSRTDFLTGALNGRAFYELAQMEINRYRRYRHPFTAAYIDLDNFKAVNDLFGHSTGDVLLRLVVETMKKDFRNSDVIARLGGDEFAVLLPETSQESAQTIIPRVHQELLKLMQEKGWSVTFSMGVVTFLSPPVSVDEMIREADALMYSVKHSGKNIIKYKVWDEPAKA